MNQYSIIFPTLIKMFNVPGSMKKGAYLTGIEYMMKNGEASKRIAIDY